MLCKKFDLSQHIYGCVLHNKRLERKKETKQKQVLSSLTRQLNQSNSPKNPVSELERPLPSVRFYTIPKSWASQWHPAFHNIIFQILSIIVEMMQIKSYEKLPWAFLFEILTGFPRYEQAITGLVTPHARPRASFEATKT